MARRDEKIDRLARVPMFSACSRRELALLASRADELSLAGGTTLVTQGRPGHEFYIILDGKAAVTRDGREVGRLGPGDFFGELALLYGYQRNATVTALTDVDVLCIDQGRFKTLLEDLPLLTRKLLTGMARRLHELDAQV